ncbi:hypothetical protein N2152v2_001637 [Parachlorella kessleri]
MGGRKGRLFTKSFYLLTTPSTVVKGILSDPSFLDRTYIYTGQPVNVTGYLNTTANPVEVQDPLVRVDGESSQLAFPVSQHSPVLKSLRLLVIPIRAQDASGNTCGGTEAITYTKEDIANALWGAGAANGGYTLSGMYEACSNGQTLVDAANSLVTDFAVLPCSGNTQYGDWTIEGCGDADEYGWQVLSDSYVTNQLGVTLSNYDFITYLGPPPTTDCPWLAVSDTNCAGNTDGYICRTWAHGDGWNAIAMYMHEFGHHFGLTHAGQEVNGQFLEYGDSSCTMGLCCGVRCYNAPHAYQMGWFPVVQLDGSRLLAGTTVSALLAPQPQGRGLHVQPDWASGATPFFLSYRQPSGYDKDLANTAYPAFTAYGGLTNIYASATWDQNGATTQWLAAIGNSSAVYSDSATGITFRHLGSEGAGVRVSVCRSGGSESLESCCYGRDNDCNGVGGQDDPACAPFLNQCSTFRYEWDLGTSTSDPGRPSGVSQVVAQTVVAVAAAPLAAPG